MAEHVNLKFPLDATILLYSSTSASSRFLSESPSTTALNSFEPKSRKKVCAVCCCGEVTNRGISPDMKLISTSPGSNLNSGSITSIANPVQPVGSMNMNGKEFDPPLLTKSVILSIESS